MFFNQAVMSSAPALLDQGALVRKARFPREIIPASIVVVQLVTFLALLVLIVPITIAIRGTLDPALLLLPLVLACLFAFVLGLAFAVSILHAYFRDVAPILSAALLPWFFLSPIFFEPSHLDRFSDNTAALFVLEWVNPVAPFIVAMRDVIYGGAAAAARCSSTSPSRRGLAARRADAVSAHAGRAGGGRVRRAAPRWTRACSPGEIVLEHASRAFSVKADRGRTLKEMLIGRARAGGPPPVEALKDVSLRIEPGETVGIVGRNGAGKSSTLRVLSGIVPLNSGRVACGGQVVAQLELGAGFGRDFSGRENIFLNGALHGLTKEQIEARMDAIVAFSELGDFIDAPVATYSSGMFLRLGFAIAAHLDADVLLIDEVLAVGDEAFQRKCEARIAEQIAAGATLVLVSHDAALIERTCERVIVLDGGAQDLRRAGRRRDAVLPPPDGHLRGGGAVA